LQEYELTAVLKPTLSQEEVDEILQNMKETISQQEGEITAEEPWGMKRLAQVIHQGGQKYLEGNYHHLRFALNSDQLNPLQNFLRLSENILRFLVVKYVEIPTPPSTEPIQGASSATTVAQDEEKPVGTEPVTIESENKQEKTSPPTVSEDKENKQLTVETPPVTTESEKNQEN
jgi:small subunit ribosomal protein S6